VVKAIALGADAVYIGTAALIAMGCAMCQRCYRGKCAWGIATNDPELAKRLDPDVATQRLINLVEGWGHEIKEILGGMGINALESYLQSKDAYIKWMEVLKNARKFLKFYGKPRSILEWMMLKTFGIIGEGKVV